MLKKHYTVQFPFECVIFILYILDILTCRDTSADSKLEESMDFDELSGYFKKILLRFSANVMDFCPICRKFETKEGMKWLACDICDRWVHLKCNPTDMNKEELHDSDYFVYYCPICNRNFGVKAHWKTGYKLNKQKEDLTKIQFFDNGLIKNPRYYVKSNYLGNYVVAKYDPKYINHRGLHDTFPKGVHIQYSYFHDISTLNKQFKIWSVYQTDMILYNLEKFHVDYFKCEFFDEICEKNNIIPLLHARHYTLILTDFPKQTFTYIDPFGSKEDMINDMFDKLNCFFKLLNKHRDKSSMTMAGFQITTVKHSIQIDNYNCGSFILHLIYCILNGFDLDTTFDPDKYRLHFKNTCCPNPKI
ncbi:hypothetical protein JTB14_002987 [Gonioctena quinquepunctata]|nr:hypothetical protein JTB14_002987 [Gonioctena quinquepunctata]